MGMLFSGVPEPLHYAEALLAQFSSLSRELDAPTVLEDFVRGAAELSACELSQLFLLDATHTSLILNAECSHGLLQPRSEKRLSTDYNSEQLLQYALCQNKVLSLSDLNASVHESGFLPASARPWKSLLCVPLLDQSHAVCGVLVCASGEGRELGGFAESLGQLGAFALGKMQQLQRPHRADSSKAARSVVPGASGYGLIGRSAAMRKTCEMIGRVMNTPYTVLLRGETGTGKEVVARAIHDASKRRAKAFIVQNCAALPEHLLESELFGYRKGAFTGADRDREGLFDAANGGTLLLDEIGDMPLLMQAKLLRVLQEGEIRPLGSNDTHKIDVRIIAASHRDLTTLVANGSFREDLYYRLAQFPIELPALRERGGDVLDLAWHFADKTCLELKRQVLEWSDQAISYLCTYSFPGNVRELQMMVRRAILMCDGDTLLPEHFGQRRLWEVIDDPQDLRVRLEKIERGLVLDCLRQTGGNQTLAARQLGLARRTLQYRLARMNIRPGDPGP